MTGEIVVLVTAPSREEAEKLAGLLIETRCAACANIVGPVTSVYRWQGEVTRDEEHLLIIKSTAARYADIESLVRANHPYELPEIVALPVAAGLDAYLSWVRSETTG
jgi:periplasmic divalent cation tolerance protein